MAYDLYPTPIPRARHRRDQSLAGRDGPRRRVRVAVTPVAATPRARPRPLLCRARPSPRRVAKERRVGDCKGRRGGRVAAGALRALPFIKGGDARAVCGAAAVL